MTYVKNYSEVRNYIFLLQNEGLSGLEELKTVEEARERNWEIRQTCKNHDYFENWKISMVSVHCKHKN